MCEPSRQFSGPNKCFDLEHYSCIEIDKSRMKIRREKYAFSKIWYTISEPAHVPSFQNMNQNAFNVCI